MLFRSTKKILPFTDDEKKDRVKFCKDMLSLAPERSSMVLYDEAMIEGGGYEKKAKVHKTQNPPVVIKTHTSARVMFSIALNERFKVRFYIFPNDTTIDGPIHTKVLLKRIIENDLSFEVESNKRKTNRKRVSHSSSNSPPRKRGRPRKNQIDNSKTEFVKMVKTRNQVKSAANPDQFERKTYVNEDSDDDEDDMTSDEQKYTEKSLQKQEKTKKKKFIANVQFLESDHPFFVVEDNSPAHVSEESERFYLKENLCIIRLPPRSPDLNPVEHAINQVKHAASKTHAKNINELRSSLKGSLEELKKSNSVKRYLNSFWKNLHECIKQKGNYIE